jgi:hypothetical protein
MTEQSRPTETSTWESSYDAVTAVAFPERAWLRGPIAAASSGSAADGR